MSINLPLINTNGTQAKAGDKVVQAVWHQDRWQIVTVVLDEVRDATAAEVAALNGDPTYADRANM